MRTASLWYRIWIGAVCDSKQEALFLHLCVVLIDETLKKCIYYLQGKGQMKTYWLKGKHEDAPDHIAAEEAELLSDEESEDAISQEMSSSSMTLKK